jgi:hypothetical protein
VQASTSATFSLRGTGFATPEVHSAVAEATTAPSSKPKICAKKYSWGTVTVTVTVFLPSGSGFPAPLQTAGSGLISKPVTVAASLLSATSSSAAAIALGSPWASPHSLAAARAPASAAFTMFRLRATPRPRSNVSTNMPSRAISVMATIANTAPRSSSRSRAKLNRLTRIGIPP